MSHLLAEMLAAFVGLAVVMSVTGRIALAGLGLPWARRHTIESWAFAALLGTTLNALAFGWGSHLGLAARPALAVTAAGWTALTGYLLVRGRLAWPALPWPGLSTLGAATAITLAVGVVALPLLVGGAFSLMHDGFTYISIAEWLQYNGFGTTAVPDPGEPVNAAVAMYQQRHLRMGAVFLLGAVRGLSPSLRAGELFVPVMAWGLVLNLGATYLICRWCLRLPRAAGLAGALVLACGYNPLGDGVTDGYLPQTYGVAVFAGLVALLSRLRAPCHWSTGGAAAIGCLTAGVVSFYSEIAPIVALVLVAFALLTGAWATRRNRFRRYARFAGLTLVAVLVLTNIEIVRATRGIVGQMNVADGRSLPWSLKDFWGYAMGGRAWWALWEPRTALLSAGATLAFLAGLRPILRRPQFLPLALALTAYALLAVALLYRPDPRTGASWDSWAEFKVCAWAYIFVLSIQCAGLARVLKAGWDGKVLVAALVFGLGLTALPAMRQIAAFRASEEQRVARSPSPTMAWRRLHKRVCRINPRNVYLVTDSSEGIWPRCMLTYLLHPYHFVNGWKGSVLLAAGPQWEIDRTNLVGPDSLVLTWGSEPPFETALEHLPGGLTRLDPTRPYIVKMDNPNHWVDYTSEPEPFSWVGSRPARFTIWSPRAGRAELTFRGLSGPARPEELTRRLVIKESTGAVKEQSLPPLTRTLVTVPLELPAGRSTIEIRCADSPSVDMRHSTGDPFEPLVMIRGPRLVLKD